MPVKGQKCLTFEKYYSNTWRSSIHLPHLTLIFQSWLCLTCPNWTFQGSLHLPHPTKTLCYYDCFLLAPLESPKFAWHHVPSGGIIFIWNLNLNQYLDFFLLEVLLANNIRFEHRNDINKKFHSRLTTSHICAYHQNFLMR